MQNDRRPKHCTSQFQTNAGIDEHHRGHKVIKQHRLDHSSLRASPLAVSCLPTGNGESNKRGARNTRGDQTVRCIQRHSEKSRSRYCRNKEQSDARDRFNYCRNAKQKFHKYFTERRPRLLFWTRTNVTPIASTEARSRFHPMPLLAASKGA